jgi:NAD(P)-dependent dehydrogenase (short-subunit alcohol dehydrogenase family)
LISVPRGMQNVLIIGASSGIGKELAWQLNSSGTQVYGTYNRTTIPQEEGKGSFYPLDVRDEPITLDFLPESLDGLVYCPGSIVLRPFSRIKPEEFVKDYELQVVGAVKVIQACLPRLKKSEQGSIILFSTIAVQLGFNFHSLISSSKGAVEGLTKALAAEFAPKIRVNCIAPSITDTPQAAGLLNSPEKREASAQRHPLKRIGSPADIADLAGFLLSTKASWITGQVFHADGGLSSVRL